MAEAFRQRARSAEGEEIPAGRVLERQQAGEQAGYHQHLHGLAQPQHHIGGGQGEQHRRRVDQGHAIHRRDFNHLVDHAAGTQTGHHRERSHGKQGGDECDSHLGGARHGLLGFDGFLSVDGRGLEANEGSEGEREGNAC